MKIELKNIHHYERMSEETEAFVADIFIDGQKAGLAKNEGHGGNTYIQGYNAKGQELLDKAEEYCKTLPPRTSTMGNQLFTYKVTLDEFVDELLGEYLEKKELLAFERKKEKAIKDNLVVSRSDTEYTTFKLPKPVSELLEFEKGEEYLRIRITRQIIPSLKEGNKLVNDNIPEKILRDAGLKDGQFIPNQLKTIAESIEQRRQTKKKGNRLR